jgi:diguanylate cyclase (GGDEF)-like protein/PAS domain S-box-containing protein
MMRFRPDASMARPRQTDLTDARRSPWSRTIIIVWPFLAIVLLQLLSAVISMDVLSGVRAFVEGESLWAKAHHEAVNQLKRYATTHDESHYVEFKRAIAVPRGDRAGRQELEGSNPDYDKVMREWMRGGNHPASIPPAIRLYRCCNDFAFMRGIIDRWEGADRLIDLLDARAEEIRAMAEAGADIRQTAVLIADIQAISERITPLNTEFSARLGEVARTTTLLIVVLNLALGASLLPLGLMLSRRMVKHGYETEDALRTSEERFQLAVAGSNDGLWDWDLVAGGLYLSPRCRELMGLSEAGNDPAARGFMRLVRPAHRRDLMRVLRGHLHWGQAFDVEVPVQSGGSERWFRLRGESVRDVSGVSVRMAGSLSDVTDRKNAEEQLYAEKERAQVTLQSIGDAVITTDIAGAVLYLNPVAEALLGVPEADALGRPLEEVCRLMIESSGEAAPDVVGAVIGGGPAQEVRHELVLVRGDGRNVAVNRSASSMRDREGRVVGAVLVLHDMTREREYAATLSYQATHDELTGLINRREFEFRLGNALHDAWEKGRHHAVIYLDLDQFKVVNDTSGHAAGDELLRRVSMVLRRRLREGDTLARLGGDEFGVLLENCGATAAERIAEQLREIVQEHPFVWHNQFFRISVSVGLVQVTGEHFTLAGVLSAADSACYLAKERGRNRVQVYSRTDSEISTRHGEMAWVGRIHRAREDNRFRLYAQEIFPVHVPQSSATHVEILVRMLDEKGKLVPPNAFLPAAERFHVMPLLDRWVLEQTFEIMEQLGARPEANPVRVCSINLSGVSIGDERLLEIIRGLFTRHRVAPHSVCFEITETAAVANLQRAVGFIEDLRDLGCRFSLDDFGAGMSSFSYLKHLPVDYVKIDGSFVRDMLTDPIDRAMVEAINHIGHVMGKRTIAEFVEDQAMLPVLREIGVDFAQGYALGVPRQFDARWGLEGEDALVTDAAGPGLATIISLPSTRRVS